MTPPPLFMSKRGDSPPSPQTASSHATIIFPGQYQQLCQMEFLPKKKKEKREMFKGQVHLMCWGRVMGKKNKNINIDHHFPFSILETALKHIQIFTKFFVNVLCMFDKCRSLKCTVKTNCFLSMERFKCVFHQNQIKLVQQSMCTSFLSFFVFFSPAAAAATLPDLPLDFLDSCMIVTFSQAAHFFYLELHHKITPSKKHQ